LLAGLSQEPLTGPLLVIITLGGAGVTEYLVRTGDEGADFEKYLVSQKLVRSDTLKGLSHEIFGPVFWPVWM
jgi:hypothetical protein